jgi:hypothetical protein
VLKEVIVVVWYVEVGEVISIGKVFPLGQLLFMCVEADIRGSTAVEDIVDRSRNWKFRQYSLDQRTVTHRSRRKVGNGDIAVSFVPNDKEDIVRRRDISVVIF